MSDSATGFDRAPTRYSAHGRETIDRIRDALGESGFHAFCIGNAMKYEDRAGLKGLDGWADEGSLAAEQVKKQDLAKARWYREMAAHVLQEGPDPRSGRPGFVPYERQS